MSMPPLTFPPLSLIQLLRSTLRRVEEMPDHDPGDPSSKELKHSILRSIAELELQRENAA